MQAPEHLRQLPVLAIAYVIRDAPITPAFVAIKRIVAARMPT